jgi:autotransporter translocation and assembly factor TamB
MKKRLLLIGFILALLLPAFLLGLMNSTTGSRWLLQAVFSSLPAQVSVKTIEGRLLERLELTDLDYRSDTETVTIHKVVFVWQPFKLLTGALKIADITLNDVNVRVTEPATPPEKSSFDFNAELSMRVAIDNLLVTNLTFQQDDQIQHLEKLHFSAFTEHGRLNIVSLSVNAKPVAVTAKGQIGLGKGFPFNLTADWQNLSWPLGNTKPQLTSELGSIELTGTLNDYRIMINGDLTQPYLPKAALTFRGTGRTDALSIEKLEVKSTAGAFQLGGNVSWKDAAVFDLSAAGQDFNPATLLPELPGNLTFNARLKGRLAGTTLQLNADIDKLSGKLRGYPVSANGTLVLADELLKVDDLHVVSGANKIAVNGTLGQEQAALVVAIDAPALESLWPGLGGSLQGDGHFQGAWKNPTINFQADGKRLRFAGYRAGQLAANIDYHADASKTSQIQLSASAVETGTAKIEKLLIDGLGTLEQHRFKIDIRSSYGDLASAFTGSLKANAWQGEFSKLDLNNPDFGRWQLMDHPALRITRSPAGIDAALAEACLVQQAAAFCMQGRYPANGDFRFQVKGTDLPTGLMQAYLPKQMKLTGMINAEAELYRQKGLLGGDYRLDMPAHAKMLLQTQPGSTELVLGPSSVSGKLEGTSVSTDFDLGLADQDYLRGQLQLDTGKTRALDGRITASVLNFAPVKPFAPQLSDIQGNLKADLTLQGTTENPVVNGTVVLKQGAVDLADQGFGLRAINLQATSVGGRSNRILLQGSAVPTALPKADAPEQFQFKGIINIDADLQQQKGLFTGHYRLDAPANSSITLKSRAAATVPLGASSLSGNINGTLISADLDLALAAQDYLRARLQLDTGETKALSGQVTASVAEFAPFNPFIQPLSNLKGKLNADLTLQGRTDKPLVSGTIGFTGGTADLTELGLELHDIKLQALASSAERIQLSGFAKSGQGSVKLDGFADLQGSAELMLSGTDFEVAKLPEAQIAVSPELTLLFTKTQRTVTGKLKIPKAVLLLKEIPKNAVKVSSDEVILGAKKTEQKPETTVNVDADIDIELGKQVSFSGQGLETNLSGKLKFIKTDEKTAIYGNVDMSKAHYKSYGQDLTVRKGRFLFNGPAEMPWLDVEAIRVSKSQDVTAILNLTGPLKAIQTHISSEPALPEAEALAYLVTGGPLNQVSKSEGDTVATAALSYGAGRLSWVADKLGVDEFAIKEGKTLQDTLATVGQYLTPDFYVGAKVGLFNKQAVLVLKHKLTKTINVETQTGTSQRIKLNYEFDTD